MPASRQTRVRRRPPSSNTTVPLVVLMLASLARLKTNFSPAPGRIKLKMLIQKTRVRLPLTRAAQVEVVNAVQRILPREGVVLTVNGKEVPHRPRLRREETVLPTVYAKDGVMHRTSRMTEVTFHAVLPGETPHIFELGIPVVPLVGGEPVHVNVHQRVPVNTDRDNVSPAYLSAIRTLVLNALAWEIKGEAASAPWVKAACNHPDAQPEAVLQTVQERFGKDFVGYDPTDTEANGTASTRGYTIIPSNALSRQERDHLRSLDKWRRAGEVFPTQGDDHACKVLREDELTNGMVEVATWAKRIAQELLGVPITVGFIDSTGTPVNTQASYGGHRLTFNVALLPGDFFSQGVTEAVDALILHELAHEYASDHRSHEYHQACNRLGAKLAHVLVRKPELLKGILYV